MEYKKNWSNFINWFLTKPKTTGFLAFIILALVGAYIVSQRYQILKENEQREMHTILSVVTQNIEQSLKNCYTTTLTMALTINDEGIPENFDYYSAKLMESNANINAVQLVPNGIIKYTYPLKGNEAAMNLNILTAPILKKEALKSIETRKMYFAGPFELKQGGKGIVGRLPVYNKNKFWGFSAVIIRLDTFLQTSGIYSVDDTKYYFQFSKTNPVTLKEEFFLPSQVDFSENYYVSTVIPDGDWKLYLIARNPNRLSSLVLLPSILGFLLAALFGFLIATLLKKPIELQLQVQKQARKLLRNELKFKAIFDQAAVGIAHVDATTGHFLEVNKLFCSQLGYTEQEMKEKKFQSITHPDDLMDNVINMKRLHNGEIREYSTIKRYFSKSGKIVWINLTVSPVWKIHEKPTTNIAIAEDITLKIEAEKLIKDSETRFRSLFDESPIPLWEEDFSDVKKYLTELDLIDKDPTTVVKYFEGHPEVVQKCISLVKIIDVNRECLKLHKAESKELLIKNLSQVLDDYSIKDFIKQLLTITKGEKNLILDSRMKDTEGEYRDINLRWNVIRGYEDSLERIIVSTEDITVRKANEKTIVDSQHKIEDLVNSIDGVVWECDYKTFELTFISKKVEAILGYTPQEWMADVHFWENHIHPDDRGAIMEAFYNIVKENKHKDSEYRMMAKNGTVVWVREIINVVFENNKPVSLRGIMIDISKTKEAEKDLNNSFQLVTEQNKRLLNFSYIVSHNLRSHTSNIESIISLIETAESEEETQHMIQLLKTVSNSLNETMNNLSEIVNIQTNIGLITDTLNLKLYINKIKNILSEQIAHKDVTIITNVDDNVTLIYNPAYLESILLNLISNAIRYSHPDRKPIIKISWLTENGHKILEVSDNGTGIDLKKNSDKIFGMYKTFSNNPDSRGIGLFITKNQIDAMGGKISVESELNVGTTFRVYIK